MDVDDIGILSPPPDDGPEMTSKAAKLMGVSAPKVSKKEISRGKQKASGKFVRRSRCVTRPADHRIVVPDPYPIDDDDIVMVNAIEDPIINAPVRKITKTSRKEVSSKSKSKREVCTKSLTDDPFLDRPT